LQKAIDLGIDSIVLSEKDVANSVKYKHESTGFPVKVSSFRGAWFGKNHFFGQIIIKWVLLYLGVYVFYKMLTIS
jgi:hypothetical protein